MGQAKQRKAEIIALKSQTKREMFPSLETFGAYYKDDTDDGVSVVLHKKDFPFLDKLVEQYEECARLMLADSEVNDADVMTQLTEAIKDYNLISYGTDVRPMKSESFINVNAEWIKVITPIITDIMYLTAKGVITDDKFNGILYIRTQGKHQLVEGYNLSMDV